MKLIQATIRALIVPSVIALIFIATVNCPAIAQAAPIPTSNLLDNVANTFFNSATQWGVKGEKYAERIFLGLAIIGLIWNCGWLALQREDLGAFFTAFMRWILFVGFFWWLTQHASSMANDIVKSFQLIGVDMSGIGSESFGPSGPLDIGFKVVQAAHRSSGLFTPIDNLSILIVCILILLALTVISVNMLTTLISIWVIVYAGSILVGFGAVKWTSDIAINYFRKVLGISVTYMTMLLMVGVLLGIMNDFATKIDQGADDMQSLLVVMVLSGAFAYLVDRLPPLVGSITGDSGGAAGTFGLGGAAAMAASAAAAAMTGGASLAANAAGGAKAIMAAVQAGSSEGGGESGGGESGGGGGVAAAAGATSSGSDGAGSAPLGEAMGDNGGYRSNAADATGQQAQNASQEPGEAVIPDQQAQDASEGAGSAADSDQQAQSASEGTGGAAGSDQQAQDASEGAGGAAGSDQQAQGASEGAGGAAGSAQQAQDAGEGAGSAAGSGSSMSRSQRMAARAVNTGKNLARGIGEHMTSRMADMNTRWQARVDNTLGGKLAQEIRNPGEARQDRKDSQAIAEAQNFQNRQNLRAEGQAARDYMAAVSSPQQAPSAPPADQPNQAPPADQPNQAQAADQPNDDSPSFTGDTISGSDSEDRK